MKFCYILTIVMLCSLTGFLAYTDHLFLAFLTLLSLSGIKLSNFSKDITIEVNKENIDKAKELLRELSEKDKVKVRIKIKDCL